MYFSLNSSEKKLISSIILLKDYFKFIIIIA